MTAEQMLPDRFAGLEPFAATWCLATEKERYTRRLETPIHELRAFYEAAFPRFQEISAPLDRFSLDELPDQERHLLYLAYSIALVSLAVDMWDQPEVIDCGNACFFRTVEPVP